MELLNLLALPNPAPTVARMHALGVLQVVLPEAEVAGLAALVAEEIKQAVAPDPIRRLAALLPPDVAVAEHVAARFRLSGAQKKRLAMAAGREKSPPLGEVASRSDDGGACPAPSPHRQAQERLPPPPMGETLATPAPSPTASA